MSSRQLKLRITGYVQGVGFRWRVCREAARLDLVGRVRNCADGSVEVIAQGPKPKLDQLIVALKDGPGRIDQVETEWSNTSDSYTSFDITH